MTKDDPVLRYYLGTPSREGVSPEAEARLAYAGGDLTFEWYIQQLDQHGASPFRWLGTAPVDGGTHSCMRGIRGLRSLPLPPADY